MSVTASPSGSSAGNATAGTTAAKQPVKNADLWKRLQMACVRHQVEWFWVKGHSGVADNELADELAARGMQEAIDASG